jgi:hypothetical protein
MSHTETLDALLARSVQSRHGVFTRATARRIGFTDAQIDHRLATGRWLALTTEALIIGGAPITFEARLLAATLSAPGAVASHEAAAQLWGMVDVPRDRIVVTIPRGGNHRIPIARVHETTDLRPRDVRRVIGVDTTSRERTMCDLGRVLGAGRLRHTYNDQFHRDEVTLEGLYDVFYRYARRGRRGMRRVRTVLEQYGPGFAVPESELEQRTLDLLRAADLPIPDGQVVLDFWDSLVGRVDFAYLHHRVLVEVDGRLFHGPDVFESDRERDNAAGLAGWQVLRFTWTMVTKRPEYVVATIARALRQAGATVAASAAS